MSGFINYRFALDAAAAGAVLGFLGACGLLGRLRTAPGAVLALVLVGGLYPLVPQEIKGTAFVATRLAVMLAFLSFIAFRPAPGRRTARLAGLAFASLLVVRVGVVCSAWWDYRTDVAGVRALLANVQPGDAVAQIDSGPADVADYWNAAPLPWRLSANDLSTDYHVWALAVIERRAFWTSLFANPDQQPFVVREPWATLADSSNSIPGYTELVARRRAGHPDGESNPYCGFDFLVLQGAWAEPRPETLAPDWLDLVGANRTAALYHVRAARSCTPKPAAAR